MSRTCPSCGAEVVAHDAAHCHRCGVRLDATSNDTASNDGDPPGGDDDWRDAARAAGVRDEDHVVATPRDPHGPHATGAPLRADSRNWAMGAHLSAFLGAWVALAFVGPLIVWLVKRDEDRFVEHHAREALNFNLLMLILLVVGGVGGVALSILTLGLAIIPILLAGAVIAVYWVVMTIVAAIKAASGEEYSYPLNISLVK